MRAPLSRLEEPALVYTCRSMRAPGGQLAGGWSATGRWLWSASLAEVLATFPGVHPIWTTNRRMVRPLASDRQLALDFGPPCSDGEAGTLPACGASRAAPGGAGAEPPAGIAGSTPAADEAGA